MTTVFIREVALNKSFPRSDVNSKVLEGSGPISKAKDNLDEMCQ